MLGLGILIPPTAAGADGISPNDGTRPSLLPNGLQSLHDAALGFSAVVFERLVNGSKLGSPCQPGYALSSGYQGGVI